MNTFLQGEVARISVLVSDVAGVPADPNTLILKVKAPTSAMVTKTYPADIIRDSAGAYRCDVILTEKGKWLWRWESDALYQGASQGDLMVTPSNL